MGAAAWAALSSASTVVTSHSIVTSLVILWKATCGSACAGSTTAVQVDELHQCVHVTCVFYLMSARLSYHTQRTWRLIYCGCQGCYCKSSMPTVRKEVRAQASREFRPLQVVYMLQATLYVHALRAYRLHVTTELPTMHVRPTHSGLVNSLRSGHCRCHAIPHSNCTYPRTSAGTSGQLSSRARRRVGRRARGLVRDRERAQLFDV